MTTDIIYLRGQGSLVEGAKVTSLRAAGYEVLVPGSHELDFAQRIIEAMRVIERVRPHLVVGAGLGGLVGLCAMELLDKLGAMRHGNLLLLGPAVATSYVETYPASVLHLNPPKGHVAILQGSQSVNHEAVARFAATRGIPYTAVPDGQKLENSHDVVLSMVNDLIGFDVEGRNARREP